MLAGVMLLWFIQVALAVLFVALHIRTTPEATVMKWGFVIITAFSPAPGHGGHTHAGTDQDPDVMTSPPGHAQHIHSRVSRRQLAMMTTVSLLIFGAGFLVAGLVGDLAMHR